MSYAGYLLKEFFGIDEIDGGKLFQANRNRDNKVAAMKRRLDAQSTSSPDYAELSTLHQVLKDKTSNQQKRIGQAMSDRGTDYKDQCHTTNSVDAPAEKKAKAEKRAAYLQKFTRQYTDAHNDMHTTKEFRYVPTNNTLPANQRIIR